jgi:hypothetical protein
MPFIAWLGRRLILVAYLTGTATFAGGALGGFLSGSLCRALTTDDSGGRPQLADAICGSFLGFGGACLATAVVVYLVVVVAARRRSRSDRAWSPEKVRSDQGRRASPAEVRPGFGGWLVVLAVILITTVVTTWLAGSPGVRFVGQNFMRFSHGLDGVVLMPPGFVLGTTGTLLFSQVGLLLLLWARSPLFPRVYVLVAVAHLGLIVCNRAMLDAVRSISAPAAAELPMLQVVETIVAASAKGLIWPLTAHAAGLALLMLEQARILFSPEASPFSRRDGVAGERMGQHRAPAATAGLFETPAAASIRGRGPSAPADLAKLGTRFSVRSVFMAWPVAGRLRVDDVDHARTLTATVAAFRLWPAIEVWLERRECTRIVMIKSRQLFGLNNAFDVTDGVTGVLLATVNKPFAADWLVHDAAGDLAAVLTRTSTGLGTATYVAMAAERPMASFAWSNVLRPSLEIDLSKDAGPWLDQRLGVALGVLLFVNLSFWA